MSVEAPQKLIEYPGEPAAIRPGGALGVTNSPDTPSRSLGDDGFRFELALFSDDELCRHSNVSSRLLLAMAGSVLVHVSLLAWAVAMHEVQPGLGGQELQAIGVEIVESAALESPTLHHDAATAAAKGLTTSQSGDEAPITQAELAATAPKSAAQTSSPAAAAPMKPDEAPVADAEIAVAIKFTPKPAPPVPEREPEVTEKPGEKELQPPKEEFEPGEADSHTPEQAAQVAGSAASFGTSDTRASDAVAGASPGLLARFAMQVRASLGRNRPKHTSRRGLVQIAFVLTETGALQTASVAKSSGNPSMDEAALAAVRAATFPRPPLGATPAQRAFIVPFEFK